ncbi:MULTISPECIES: dihydrodipicolinate synthase family protein [Sphingomonas]|uniref:dihydrodipicolinate synthase family protein n=1 Tax=Sphingomonas TaxID=13687 RepID=UPI001300CDDC|nr:dihydrodipicolinate synthase family protein [Sphingomonas turrisvirgatae]
MLPVVPTPFTRDLAVDHASLHALVDYAVRCGAGAIVYPGVASEDVQLNDVERCASMRTVVEAAAGRIAVVGGVNAAEFGDMVANAKWMAKTGVAGIMAMAVPTMAAKGYASCYQELAAATGGLPIILQNLVKPRGADLLVEEMLDIAGAVDAVRYVKEEAVPPGPKVGALVASGADALDGVIGGGGARFLFEELERGVIATMPAMELLELHVAMLRDYGEGRRDAAFELYQASLPLLLLQASYRMRLTKLVLKHRGIIATDEVREPLPQLDEVTRRLVLEYFMRLPVNGVKSDG